MLGDIWPDLFCFTNTFWLAPWRVVLMLCWKDKEGLLTRRRLQGLLTASPSLPFLAKVQYEESSVQISQSLSQKTKRLIFIKMILRVKILCHLNVSLKILDLHFALKFSDIFRNLEFGSPLKLFSKNPRFLAFLVLENILKGFSHKYPLVYNSGIQMNPLNSSLKISLEDPLIIE